MAVLVQVLFYSCHHGSVGTSLILLVPPWLCWYKSYSTRATMAVLVQVLFYSCHHGSVGTSLILLVPPWWCWYKSYSTRATMVVLVQVLFYSCHHGGVGTSLILLMPPRWCRYRSHSTHAIISRQIKTSIRLTNEVKVSRQEYTRGGQCQWEHFVFKNITSSVWQWS